MKDHHWATIIIIGLITFGAAMVPVFTWLDCYNATRWSEALQRCEDADDCTLNEYQRRHLKRWIKLQIMRCDQD